METSVNELEPNQSFRSPPKRRRSTFFERRESIVPQTISENIDPISCEKKTEAESKQQERLAWYCSQLLIEKEEWKKEANNKRSQYHDLKQQYQEALKAPSRSRISYSALSYEDIEFIKAKPNLLKIVENQQQLHKNVLLLSAISNRINELDNVALSYCEDKVKQVTEYILENSTIEPKD